MPQVENYKYKNTEEYLKQLQIKKQNITEAQTQRTNTTGQAAIAAGANGTQVTRRQNTQAGKASNTGADIKIKTNSTPNINIQQTGAGQLIRNMEEIMFGTIAQMSEDCLAITDLTSDEYDIIKLMSGIDLVDFGIGTTNDIINKYKTLKGKSQNGTINYDLSSIQSAAEWMKSRNSLTALTSGIASDAVNTGLYFQALNTCNTMVESSGDNNINEPYSEELVFYDEEEAIA